MAKAQQIVKGKVLKKDWHPIKSTKAFNSTALGESYVTSPDQLLDRHLTVNLANLTGDIRQQGTSLHFRVTEIDNGAGVAGVVGYEASPAQLKRLVRRDIERLDDSIECTTSDGKHLRIKPFAVTKTSASKYKLRLMRILLRKAMVEEVAKQEYNTLVRSIISNKLQSTLKSIAKKVFPLRALEIRKLELIKAAKPASITEQAKSAKKKQDGESKKSIVSKTEEKQEAPKKAQKSEKPAEDNNK